MIHQRRRGREGNLGTRVWDPVMLQEQLDARHIRAHERALGDHQRLMAVADVIREESPLGRGSRLNHKRCLESLDDFDHEARLLDDEAVAAAENVVTRQ